MSSFRNVLSVILFILSAAMGGAGIFSETTLVNIYFSHTSYWFASLWTIIASLVVRPKAEVGLY